MSDNKTARFLFKYDHESQEYLLRLVPAALPAIVQFLNTGAKAEGYETEFQFGEMEYKTKDLTDHWSASPYSTFYGPMLPDKES